MKESLSVAIAEVILKKYGKALLSYYYDLPEYNFSCEEKEIIEKDFESFGNSEIIREEVAAFLENASSISIEGFVKFRLSGFKAYIKNKLDRYEEKLEAVREYDDLILLLKAYVNNLPHCFEVLNINITNSGGYALFDESGNDITEECIKTISERSQITDTSFDDLLLACVVTAAPEKVVIHGEKWCRHPEFIMLIKRIFEGKVENCDRCKLCNL